jgi:glutamate-1-semialdehyde 2,1-aminomutase
VSDRYPGSRALYARAQALIPGTTQTISKRPAAYAPGSYPMYADRGEGSNVWDVDGNRYVDYVLACGPIVLGYQHPSVQRAVTEQLGRGSLFGLLSPVEVIAAEAIAELVPRAEMVRFFKGGADATSAAARLARALTGRERIASSGYHGWHDQWVVNDPQNRAGVPHRLVDLVLPFAYSDLAGLEALFEEFRGEIAAVILEPLTVDAYDESFLQAVRRLTRATGALLIFDEIVTGFRLAPGGAQQWTRVEADLTVFAKALANGFPLAALCGPRDMMRTAADLFITSTYGDEALSLAACAATLEVMRDQPVHDSLWRIGGTLMSGLHSAAQETGAPVRLVGQAPMFRIAFDATALKSNGVTPRAVWRFLLSEMARRGVLWRPGGITFVSYAHTEADIQETVAAAQEVFAALADELRSGGLAPDGVAEPMFER